MRRRGIWRRSRRPQNRLLTDGATSYTYTATSERQTKTVNGQTTAYTYNAFGTLRSVTLPDGTQVGYILDGQQRRVGKAINGQLVQAFAYQDQLRPIAEFDGNGNLVSQFVYASRANVPDYLIRGGTTYRIIADHVGSPRLVVNAATGDVVQQLAYDVWGNITQDTNPGFQPFGFAGGLYDPHTRLTRFGARDYDAETGRWTSQDPLGFDAGDTNLYRYVFNDPVNFVDMTGEIAIPAIAVAIGVGALSSVLMGALMAKLFGECYGWKDALIDAALGGATAGAANWLNGLRRIATVRGIAKASGWTKPKTFPHKEVWVGPLGKRYQQLAIKYKPATTTGIDKAYSRYARISLQVGRAHVPHAGNAKRAPLYWEPFKNLYRANEADPSFLPTSHIRIWTYTPIRDSIIGGAASFLNRTDCICN